VAEPAAYTHPAFQRRGIANRLIDEVHKRMREAGLRFSTLGTARHRGAYTLYKRLGYEDVFIPTFTFVRLEDVRQDTAFIAGRAALADRLADSFIISDCWLPGLLSAQPGFLAMMIATGDLGASDDGFYGMRSWPVMPTSISGTILAVNGLLLGDKTPLKPWQPSAKKERSLRACRVDHPSVGSLLRGGYHPHGLAGHIHGQPLVPDQLEAAYRLLNRDAHSFVHRRDLGNGSSFNPVR
jgi:hypothetical protein